MPANFELTATSKDAMPDFTFPTSGLALVTPNSGAKRITEVAFTGTRTFRLIKFKLTETVGLEGLPGASIISSPSNFAGEKYFSLMSVSCDLLVGSVDQKSLSFAESPGFSWFL